MAEEFGLGGGLSLEHTLLPDDILCWVLQFLPAISQLRMVSKYWRARVAPKGRHRFLFPRIPNKWHHFWNQFYAKAIRELKVMLSANLPTVDSEATHQLYMNLTVGATNGEMPSFEHTGLVPISFV
jgi:hypothetical protein